MSATLSSHASGPANHLGRLYALGLLLAVAGFCVLPADMYLSRAFYGGGTGELAAEPAFHVPGDIRRIVSLCEIFGHGSGLAMIVLTVLVLDATHRRTTLRIGLGAFGAGLLATLLKFLILRTRPLASDLNATPWETFGGWLPLGEVEHALRSAPSGHSTQAAALAVLLAWRYPRGKYLFACFAGLAMLQRITSGAHFPSDTLWGAGVGVAFATACLDPRLLGRVFDRFESRGKTSEPSALPATKAEQPASSSRAA